MKKIFISSLNSKNIRVVLMDTQSRQKFNVLRISVLPKKTKLGLNFPDRVSQHIKTLRTVI